LLDSATNDAHARGINAAGYAVVEGRPVDAAGKIYVTNVGDNFPGNGTVTTYTANGTPTTPMITGLSNPQGVAVH
jgi:hypothetical protein